MGQWSKWIECSGYNNRVSLSIGDGCAALTTLVVHAFRQFGDHFNTYFFTRSPLPLSKKLASLVKQIS